MPIVIDQLTYSYQAKPAQASPEKAEKKRCRSAAALLHDAAIEGISMTVAEGEFLGIIGHTGSGKSTLVQQIAGLLTPTSGSVTVDGFDTRDKAQKKQARARVGLVFQYPEYQLFEETVAKDVAFGPKNLGLPEAEIAERVREALTLVGLTPARFSEKSPFDLSGGEKRRAALAGILAMRPKYLVLDEPMAGLDPRGRREILKMLEQLRRTAGCAILMVSHSMDDVARHADRVAVLRGGRLERLASAAEVFADAEALASMGLNAPQVTRLAQLLRARGLDVPAGTVDPDALLAAILTAYRGKREVRA